MGTGASRRLVDGLGGADARLVRRSGRTYKHELSTRQTTDTAVQIRSFAAVIFRRVATRTAKDSEGRTNELFLTLQKPQRDAIRAKLLECLASESEASVRNKSGDAIAEIARQYVDGDVIDRDGTKESWNELLGALFQASQSSDAGQRATAFRIFATTPGIIEKQHEEVVIGAFTKGFQDSDVMVGAGLSIAYVCCSQS